MELTLASAANDMTTIYQREKTILPYERAAVPFLDGIKESSEGMKLLGNVLEFNLRLHDGYGIGTPDDGGDWSEPRQHRAVKAQVTKAQLDAALLITIEAEAAGQGDGSFTGDPLGTAVESCLRVYMYQKNCLYLGHGTGRFAVVAADANATDTVIMDLPEGCFQLRVGAFYEFADLDVGGTVQNLGLGAVEAQVESIDLLTQTVIFDRNITVSAGWGVYVAGTYGKRKPNGMRNIVDNGALTDSIFNIDRDDFPQVNATMLDNGGALQDYDEALVRDLLVQITQKTDLVPTEFWSNEGIRSEHYRHTTPDRIFQVVGKGEVPGYNIGANQDELAFHWAGQKIPFKCDRNIPARSLYALYKPGWRKHTLIPDDWLKQGGAQGHVMLDYAPAAGGVTKSNNMIGSLQGNGNCSHKHLNAQGALLNVRDRGSARD